MNRKNKVNRKQLFNHKLYGDLRRFFCQKKLICNLRQEKKLTIRFGYHSRVGYLNTWHYCSFSLHKRMKLPTNYQALDGTSTWGEPCGITHRKYARFLKGRPQVRNSANRIWNKYITYQHQILGHAILLLIICYINN